MPRANTPTGSQVLWGPKSMYGGEMRAYSGDLSENITDLQVKGRGLDFVWARRYLSRDGVDSSVGNGWDFSYNICVENANDTNGYKKVSLGSGREVTFEHEGYVGLLDFYRAEGWAAEVSKHFSTGAIHLNFDDGITWLFDTDTNDGSFFTRLLTSITDKNGNSLEFAYDANDRLDTITDALGRVYSVAYIPTGPNAGNIESVTDFDGRVVGYEYYVDADTKGNAGDLKKVNYPDGRSVTYEYTSGKLDKIIDGNGNAALINEYTGGKVSKQIRPHDTLTPTTFYDYSTYEDGGGERPLTIVKDAKGHVQLQFYNELNQLVKLREYTGAAAETDAPTTWNPTENTFATNPPLAANKSRPGDPEFYETAFDWNAHDNLTQTIEPSGLTTAYTYEDETKPLKRGAVKTITRSHPDETGTLTVTNTYKTLAGSGRIVVETVTDEENKTTTYAYDPVGNLTGIAYPGGNIATPDESFDYNDFGQLEFHYLPDSTGVDGQPVSRVDHLTYHTSGAQEGCLASIIQAEGSADEVTTSFTYDAYGNLETRTDPKGKTWSYTYSTSDEIETVSTPTVTLDGATAQYATAYTYDFVGNLLSTTTPNIDETGANLGNIINRYVYDPANRVMSITRDEGGINATTAYSYDANGNSEMVKTPLANSGEESNNVVETQYDERDLLLRTIRSGVLSYRMDYNLNGNLERIVEVEGTEDERVTETIYDGFDRAIERILGLGSNEESRVFVEFDGRGLPLNSLLQGPMRGVAYYNPELEGPPEIEVGNLAASAYTYDNRGRLTKLTQGADSVGTTFTYTDSSQIRTVTNPDGEVTTIGYDPLYRTARVSDAAGNVLTTTYDDNSNTDIVTRTDINGVNATSQVFVTEYTYDELNRVVEISAPAGRLSKLHYDSRGNVVKAVDPRENYSIQTFDDLGRPTSQSFFSSGGAVLGTTQMSWDLNSRLKTRTDPLNKTTTYHYNDLGWNRAIEYADGGLHTVLRFDHFGNPEVVQDPNGTIVTSQFDTLNRLVARLSQSDSADVSRIVEGYSYDGLSRVTQAANADVKAVYQYDTLAAEPKTMEYLSVGAINDVEGQSPFPSRELDPVIRTYSHAGRLKKISYPSGREITHSHTSNGLLNTITDGESVVLADYDYVGGRVARRTVGGAVRMDVGYLPATNGAHISGISHTKTSNSLGLESWLFSWDLAYNKTGRTDVIRSIEHGYNYDSVDRLGSTTLNGAPGNTYGLDAAGNRNTTPYTTAVTPVVPESPLHAYLTAPSGDLGYDANGNLRSILPTNPLEQEQYYFDARDEFVGRWLLGTALQDILNGVIPDDYLILGGAYTAENGYLEKSGELGGRIVRENVPSDADQITVSYMSTHDPADPDGNAASADYAPEYYGLVLMNVAQYEAASPDDEWSYLALVIEPERLTLNKWENDGVTEVATAEVVSEPFRWYSLEINFSGANRDHVTIRHALHGGGFVDQIDADTGLDNNATDIAFGTGDNADYKFRDVIIRGDSISAPSMHDQYVYDVFGRRVASLDYATGQPVLTYFVHDGARVAEELDANGRILASYVYGNYVDEVLQMQRNTDGDDDLDTTYYYLHDDMYNVLAVTDDTGAIVERYAYGDYGAPTIRNAGGAVIDGSAIDNPYLFNGRHFDSSTGLYYYRTRYMDPEIGRFISRDTIGLWGDEANLGNPYTYAGNNPWSKLDPYGEEGGAPAPNFGKILWRYVSGEYLTDGQDLSPFDANGDAIHRANPAAVNLRAAHHNAMISAANEGNLQLGEFGARWGARGGHEYVVGAIFGKGVGGAGHGVGTLFSQVTEKAKSLKAKGSLARGWKRIFGGPKPARFGQLKISSTQYKQLRRATPNDEAYAFFDPIWKSLPPGQYYDDWLLPGEKIKRMAVDHIVPYDRIVRMEGFDLLTNEQQLAVINNMDNFMVMSNRANSSKGNQTFAEWWGHQGLGAQLNSEFKAFMLDIEASLESQLQKQIDDFLKIGSK